MRSLSAGRALPRVASLLGDPGGALSLRHRVSSASSPVSSPGLEPLRNRTGVSEALGGVLLSSPGGGATQTRPIPRDPGKAPHPESPFRPSSSRAAAPKLANTVCFGASPPVP